MKITALGTNGWFDTATGSTNCTLIQTSDYSVVLDAGYGIAKSKTIVDFTKPVFIFLTHLHLDHVIGLHVLDAFEFEQPLRIIAPIGGAPDLKELMRKPFTTRWDKHPYPIEILDSSELAAHEFPFEVEALPLVHAVPDTGYRFTINGKIIAFVLDTAYCENAVRLSQNADFLITESGFLPETVNSPAGHMNPETAARLAKEAGAKKVLLIHFGANSYDTIDKRREAVDSGRDIYPELIMGLDNMEFIL